MSGSGSITHADRVITWFICQRWGPYCWPETTPSASIMAPEPATRIHHPLYLNTPWQQRTWLYQRSPANQNRAVRHLCSDM